jgi:anti-sigma B factor antagonist
METAQFRSEAVDASSHVIAVAGEVDLANADQLELHIERAADDGASGVVIDLSEVTHLDSTALAKLLGARESAASRVRLVLVVPAGQLHRTFEVRGLEGLFTLAGSRKEALALVHEND